MALVVVAQARACCRTIATRRRRARALRPRARTRCSSSACSARCRSSAKGAVLDWSAVFLRFSRGFSEAAGGLAYAAFSVTMGIGRLAGDAMVGAAWAGARPPGRRAGSRPPGSRLATATPSAASAVARVRARGPRRIEHRARPLQRGRPAAGVPAGMALAAVTTIGYAGLLAGPALVGFVAQVTSLPVALALTGAFHRRRDRVGRALGARREACAVVRRTAGTRVRRS